MQLLRSLNAVILLIIGIVPLVLSQPTTQTLTTKTKLTLSPTTTFIDLGPGQNAIKVMMAAVTVGVPQPQNPKIFTKPVLPGEQAGANWCKNPYDLENVWCFNQPMQGIIQYIEFHYVKFLNPGTYYFGMYYGTFLDNTKVMVQVNGIQQFGNVNTPNTGGWYNMVTAVADNPITVTTAVSNTIRLSVALGRVNIEYIIISTVPITSTAPVQPAPNVTVVAPGENLVLASSFSAAQGYPNPHADQFFSKATVTNFCYSKLDTRIEYWCMNGPINGSMVSSLTFNYNFPSNGNYYFGLNYASNTTASRLKVYVDNVETFGYVPTFYTGPYIFHRSASTTPANIKSGPHTIKLVPAMGSIGIHSFIISSNPIANAVTYTPQPDSQPPGADTVLASTYTSAVGVPNVLRADYTFPGHATTNFCVSRTDPSMIYWCLNQPVNTTTSLGATNTMSSLSFNYNFPGDGTYYFGLIYATSEPYAILNVYLDGQQSWGYMPTPATGGRDIFVVGAATQSYAVFGAGVHNIQLEVTKGTIGVYAFIISTQAIQITATTVAPIVFTGSRWIVAATSYASASGHVSPLADKTFVDAAQINFCRNSKDTSMQYWCHNEPYNGLLSRLTFNFNFPYTGTFYFGVNYATAHPIAVMHVLLDGVRQWGYVPTPKTGNWNIFATQAAVQPVAVTRPGWHTIDLVVSRGSINVVSFIISTKAIPAPNVYPVPPAGQTFVQAETFVSAVGVPTPFADQFFPGKDLANFCISHINPSVEYWCYNKPVNGSIISSLTFNYRFAAAGTYYFAASYATNSSRTLMNVYIDGVQNFGFFITPSTGGWEKFEIASASQGAVVKNTYGNIHTIELEVAVGKIHIDYFIISNAPITPTITTPAPIIPTTPPGGVVLQHVKYLSGSSSIVSLSAVMGVLVALLVLYISRNN